MKTKIKIEGCGVYCCVYYLEQNVFDEIINVNIQNIPESRFNLIEKNCSSKQLVSKGFFANTDKKVTQVSFIDRDGKALPLGYMDVDCAYTRLHENNTFDPKDHTPYEKGVESNRILSTFPKVLTTDNRCLDIDKFLQALYFTMYLYWGAKPPCMTRW